MSMCTLPTHLQRFTATLLLFSLLLQSCGRPQSFHLQEEKATQAAQETQQDREQKAFFQADAKTNLDNDDITVRRVEDGGTYDSKKARPAGNLRSSHYGVSSQQNLINCFQESITAQLTSKVNSTMVQPLTSMGTNWVVDKAFEGSMKTLKEQKEKFRAKREWHNASNELANQAGNEWEEKKASTPEEAKAQEAAQLKNLSQEGQEKYNNTKEGGKGTLADVGAAAKSAGRPIIMRDADGNIIEKAGRGLQGEPIELTYNPENGGHWSVKGAAVANSGTFNCLFDAVESQFTESDRTRLGIKNGEEFRGAVAETFLRNPQMANQLAARESVLRHTQPEALLEGGRVLEYLTPQYHLYRFTGNKAGMLRIETAANKIEDNALNFGTGTANALSSNFSLGTIPRINSQDAAFAGGQFVGDMFSMVGGVLEMGKGGGMMAIGGASIMLSNGMTVPVSMPLWMAGVSTAAHGSLVVANAVKGVGNGGGGGGGSKAPTQKSGAQDKILSDGEIKKLKKAGHDIHDLKHRGSKPAWFDLYKDAKGNIFKKLKGGKGEAEPLFMNINEL